MTTEIRPPAAHQRPSGKMYLSADQLNLVSAVWTVVELNTISANFGDGIEDTAGHRITPGVAGFYDVKGQVAFKNVIADKSYYASVRINGVTYKGVVYDQAAIAANLTVPVNLHLYLSDTDYLELLAISIAGVNTVDVYAGETRTFLSVQRVR